MRESVERSRRLQRMNAIACETDTVDAVRPLQPAGQSISHSTKDGFKVRPEGKDVSPSVGVVGSRWGESALA